MFVTVHNGANIKALYHDPEENYKRIGDREQ